VSLQVARVSGLKTVPARDDLQIVFDAVMNLFEHHIFFLKRPFNFNFIIAERL